MYTHERISNPYQVQLKEQQAAQEPLQRDNLPNSKAPNRPNPPTVRSWGQKQQGHSVVTTGHQKKVSKPHLSSTESKPVSKLPQPVQQCNNMKGPSLRHQMHSSMIDHPCGIATIVIEEQVTNAGSTQTMVSKQTQDAGNVGQSTAVPGTLQSAIRTSSQDPQIHRSEGNVPQQPRRNNDRLLDARSLQSGAPVPEIRNSKARLPALPDLGPPPPLPVPMKLQAGKVNETLSAAVIPPRAGPKPQSMLPARARMTGRSRSPPGTVTVGTQAVTSTQPRLKSLTTDSSSLVTITAEFNPRLGASGIGPAPAFTPETDVKEHRMDAEKITHNFHASGTPPPPYLPGELSSDFETSFQALALTQRDWEEIAVQGRAQGNMTEQDLQWIKIFKKLQEKSNPRTDHAHEAESAQSRIDVGVRQGTGGDEKKPKKARKKGKKNRQNGKPDTGIRGEPSPMFEFGKTGPAGGMDQGDIKVNPNPTFEFGKAGPTGGMNQDISPQEYILLARKFPEARSQYLRETAAATILQTSTQQPDPIPRILTLNSHPVNLMTSPYNSALPSTPMAIPFSNSGQSPKPMDTAQGASELKLDSLPPPVIFLGVEDHKQASKVTAPYLAPHLRPFDAGKATHIGGPYMGTETQPSTLYPPLPPKGGTASLQTQLPGQANLLVPPAPPVPARFRATNVAKPAAAVQSSAENISSKPEGSPGERMATYIISSLERDLLQDQVEAQYATRLKHLASGRPLKTVADGHAFKGYIKKYIETYVTSRIVRIFHEFRDQSFLTEELKNELRGIANRAIPMRQDESERLVEQFLNTFVILIPIAPNSALAHGSSTQQSSVEAPQKKVKNSALTENIDSKFKTAPTIPQPKLKTTQESETNSRSTISGGIPSLQVKSAISTPTGGAPPPKFTEGNTPGNKPTQTATVPVHQNDPKQQELKGKQPTLRRPETQGKQPVPSPFKPPFFKQQGNDEWAYERMYSDEYFRILNKMNPDAQKKQDEKAPPDKVRLGKRRAETKDSGCGVVWCTGCQACPGRNLSSTKHPRGQSLISIGNGDTILVETSVDNWKDTEAFTLNPVTASTREDLMRGGVPFKPFKAHESEGYGFDHSTQTQGRGCKGGYDGSNDNEEEEELVNLRLAELEKGIRAKQKDLMAELVNLKAEQEKSMVASEALAGFVIGQAPVNAPSNENAPGASASTDKSGGKKKQKKKKGKGKK